LVGARIRTEVAIVRHAIAVAITNPVEREHEVVFPG
jgi:hypothetical protein